MRIKQDFPTYNAPIYMRTECSERKKSRGPNKKKIREVKKNLVHNLRSEFDPHRHLRRRQVLIFITRKYTVLTHPNSVLITY